MNQMKTTMSFNEGMKAACKVITDTIKDYAFEKYDDYETRQYLSERKRMNNELARNVVDDLLKFLENVSSTIDEQLVKDKLNEAEAPKEIEDVGTDGNGKVSAEAVRTGGERPEKEVSEIHTGLPKA